ncbi:hypothetical protein [Erythrobacter sp.]|uniref:hypothetical protein n=1 Tax=Erythrobacter sp. TaxID=1042 RepID=UPI001B2CABEE|nr:hypothetical protein [Erythrobacter sp.]MBO6526947.1 hypothetical protein [Erythrobacter sp.]MBO6528619.1 hypothetical protein [Erythrobacter sp.]
MNVPAHGESLHFVKREMRSMGVRALDQTIHSLAFESVTALPEVAAVLFAISKKEAG